jgi:hypothetical protein
MPTILDQSTGVEREVSDAEYQALRNEVRGEQRDAVYTERQEGAGSTAVWDCVDKTWSAPLPNEYVYKHYLQKVVARCSACTFTSAFDGDIAKHVEQIQRDLLAHQGARLTEPVSQVGLEPVQTCTGCGASFRMAGYRGQRHLEQIAGMEKNHDRVELLVIKRFALEPSEPIVLRREVVVDGPVSRQVERVEPSRVTPKRRRRKRGHRRASRTATLG